jgi:hypothetical protein
MLQDTIHRMIGDALQDMSQLEPRVEMIEFCRAVQAVNGCCARTTGSFSYSVLPFTLRENSSSNCSTLVSEYVGQAMLSIGEKRPPANCNYRPFEKTLLLNAA